MVRKKGTPIYFAVNQRDPMVVQAVKPFKPFGPFVTEVLQMSGREPMQPATVEVQNWRNHSNPAIETLLCSLLNDCITCCFTTFNKCISGGWKETSATKADVLQSDGV
ncbi:hypothetical protein Bca52824_053724 [Brassica carinata]|uniref:Uncharacterized protein n=1 Tax=Brassica carinata TaxID=52824 RepID=A0A8X7RC55_BRACI|nr:hypothetical protein Bca52824_053724 [Brassica carinata]